MKVVYNAQFNLDFFIGNLNQRNNSHHFNQFAFIFLVEVEVIFVVIKIKIVLTIEIVYVLKVAVIFSNIVLF